VLLFDNWFFAAERSEAGMAEGRDQPMLLDPDAVMEEIYARKGPQKYTGGLSEDNWEEVRGKEGEG